MKKKILLAILISSILILTASSAVSAGSTSDGGNKIFFKKSIHMDHVQGHIAKFLYPYEKGSDVSFLHLRIVVDFGVVTIGDKVIETPCTINVFLFNGDFCMWDKLGFHDPNTQEDLTVENAFGVVIVVS